MRRLNIIKVLILPTLTRALNVTGFETYYQVKHIHLSKDKEVCEGTKGGRLMEGCPCDHLKKMGSENGGVGVGAGRMRRAVAYSPGTILNTLQALCPRKLGAALQSMCYYPILQIVKLRLKETKPLAQSHIVP